MYFQLKIADAHMVAPRIRAALDILGLYMSWLDATEGGELSADE